jgi:hypothetical protein
VQPFGVALLLTSAIAAIGWLLAGRSGGWQSLVPGIGDSQKEGSLPKQEGSEAQPVGPATMEIPVAGNYSPTAAAQGAGKAAQPSASSFQAAVTPVLPPRSATYVPSWTNPDSSDTQVD